MIVKICEICGTTFLAKRKDAKCCSVTCRKRKQLWNSKVAYLSEDVVSNEVVRIENKMTDGEILGVIQQAHHTVTDLSRASVCTQGELSKRLDRVSRGLKNLLEGEQL